MSREINEDEINFPNSPNLPTLENKIEVMKDQNLNKERRKTKLQRIGGSTRGIPETSKRINQKTGLQNDHIFIETLNSNTQNFIVSENFQRDHIFELKENVEKLNKEKMKLQEEIPLFINQFYLDYQKLGEKLINANEDVKKCQNTIKTLDMAVTDKNLTIFNVN